MQKINFKDNIYSTFDRAIFTYYCINF